MSEPDENGWAAEIKARAASILCEAGALCGWPAPNCNAREGAEALYQAGLLAARSTVPEAGKAVDDARQLPAVEVMSADTLPSGDEYLISKAFVHEGAIIALYGTNDKLIGWIDTNAWMKGRVYRERSRRKEP